MLIAGGGWRMSNPWPTAISLSGQNSIPIDASTALDLTAIDERLKDAIRQTRILRWSGGAQLFLMAVLAPLSALSVGPEAALLAAAVPFGLLHLVSLLLMARAQSVVLPGVPGRTEALAIAALYPPSLIRAGTDIVKAAFAKCSLIELAALKFDDELFESFLRRELGQVESPRFPSGAAEREVLLEVGIWRGYEPSEIVRPRSRTDESAESYCAACGQDYRAGFRFCGECEIETRLYAD
jgi:hypothetical protein